MMTNHFVRAPEIRPSMNVGCLFDVPTGNYSIGAHGESIMNGGVSLVTGIGGRGNTFKSTVAHFLMLRVCDRYQEVDSVAYDAEPPSISRRRFEQLSASMPNLSVMGFPDDRFMITDATVMLGNDFFGAVKKMAHEKTSKENIKGNTLKTPFLDSNKKHITVIRPTMVELDSLSMMPVEAVETIYDKNDIGASGMNVEALRSSGAKSQMLMQLPILTGSHGVNIIMTAHAGDDLALDPYAPPAKKLAFLKNKVKFKQVPEKFTFLTNNLYISLATTPALHKEKKTTLYPRDQYDTLKGDTDLQVVTIQNLRAKNGPAGLPFDLVVSQREGVMVQLSEYHYLKTFDYFGLGGNNTTHYLELVPDVSLGRTTIRAKSKDPKIARALEITSELCQMFHLWTGYDEIMCRPEDLYKDLKAKGYDWDVLLNTRGYWVFDDSNEELPFLSTMDLLRMRAGLYHPYWMKPLESASNAVKLATEADAAGDQKAKKAA